MRHRNVRGGHQSYRGIARPEFEALERRDLLASVMDLKMAPMLTEVGLSNPDVGLLSFTSDDGNASDFRAVIDWGDGTYSPATIGAAQAEQDGTYFFGVSGNHTYADTSPTTITIAVLDPQGNPSVATGPVTVLDHSIGGIGLPIDALTGAQIGQFIADSGPVPVPIAGVLDVADPNPFDQTMTIDWGDGTPPYQGAVVSDPVTGVDTFAISGDHVFENTGVYTVRIVDTDKLGNSTTITTTAVVAPILNLTGIAPIAGPGTVTAGASSSFSATFTAGLAPVVAIDWGDGSPPTAASLTSQIVNGAIGEKAGALYTASGAHTYAQPGLYTPRIIALDAASGYSAVSSSSIAVGPAVLSATASPITSLVDFGLATGPSNPTLSGSPTLATFQDPAATPLQDFVAGITWGDGTSSSSDVELNPATDAPQAGESGFVTGGHVYLTPGDYTVTIYLLDSKTGSLATATTTATTSPIVVSEIPRPFVYVGPDEPSPTVNDFVAGQAVSSVAELDSNNDDPASNYAIAIDWGDGSAPTGGTLTAPPDGEFHGASSFTVGGSHVYTTAGTYTLTVTALDTATGQSTIGHPTLTIEQPAISPFPGSTTITATAGQSTGEVGLGGFSTNDSVTASVDWGDGTAPTPAQISSFVFLNEPNEDVSSSGHTYAQAGTYNVTVNLVGALGSRATITDTAVIAPAPAPPPLSSTPLPLPTVRPGIATSLNLGTISATDTTLKAGALSAFVNYGDGSKVVLAKVVKTGAGTFKIIGQHTYKQVGSYAIQVSASEKNGNSTIFDDTVPVARPS